MNAVDTNVLVYACEKRDAARQRRAQELIDKLQDGAMLWQVACEFIAAARKLGPTGFTAEDAWLQLADLLRAFRLIVPSPSVLDRARDLELGRQLHVWDAMIFAACIEAGVTRIYCEDLPGTASAGLEVVNPFA